MTALRTVYGDYVWLCTVNNVRTIFEGKDEYVYIPDLRPTV